jgi:hypothetical protein
MSIATIIPTRIECAFGLRVGQRIKLMNVASNLGRRPSIGTTGSVVGFNTDPHEQRIHMDWDSGEDYPLVPTTDGWQKI